MPIKVYTGVDIIHFHEIEALISKERGQQKYFTHGEIHYCLSTSNPREHFAACFAAKEAAFKALGKGILEGYSIRDVEVTHKANGKPILNFSGKLKEYLEEERDLLNWDLSLSHSENLAIGMVVLLEEV